MSRAITKASKVSLTPNQVSKMRAEIFQAISEQLPEAHKVVMGEVNWSPTQARVFGLLLGKVIPDLHVSYAERERDDKPLNELSRAELEAIVAKTTEIEHDPSEFEDAEIIED